MRSTTKVIGKIFKKNVQQSRIAGRTIGLTTPSKGSTLCSTSKLEELAPREELAMTALKRILLPLLQSIGTAVLLAITAFATNTPAAHAADHSILIEPDARLPEQLTHEQVRAVATFVKAYGYRCDSISSLRTMLFSPGFVINCNRYRYTYEVEDRGGNWVVTID